MRWLVMVVMVAVMAAAAACTRHNPAVCCQTPEQCTMLDLDMMYGCEGEKVCTIEGACVDPQCTTAADCTSPEAPLCVNKVCVGACQSNQDCAFVPDAICDKATGECRACEHDNECDSGVCLGAESKCIPAERAIFLRSDGVDTGSCTASSPCQSFGFAISQLTASRDVIHLMGASYSVGANPVQIPFDNVFVDGDDTTVTRTTEGPVFRSVNGGTLLHVTLSDMSIGAGDIGIMPGAIFIDAGIFRLVNVTLQAGIEATPMYPIATAFEIDRSIIAGRQTVFCSAGAAISIRRSTLHMGVSANACRFTLEQSVFDGLNAALTEAGDSYISIENNLFIASSSNGSAISISGQGGSIVRFNTFVNKVASSAPPITCTASTTNTSNIFAWKSSMAPPCATRYSLFDSATAPSGAGNITGDVSTFFVDAADYHLSTSSPARGAAEPGLELSVDIDGELRPSPAGSTPDIGSDETQ